MQNIPISMWKLLLMKGIKGEVYTMNLFLGDVYTFGRIKLMPHSEIPLHQHTNDCEWYIDEESGKLVDFCPKGQSHSFANDTDDIKYLLFVKKVA